MHFNSIEEVVADDHFQAWFYRTHEKKAKEWEHWLLEHQEYVLMVQQAIAVLKELSATENEIPNSQLDEAYMKLQKTLDQKALIPMEPEKKSWLKWWKR